MRGQKILVVDDDQLALETVAGCLEDEGYHVITYDQGRGAFDLIAAERPDLVILDVVLPFIDGLEICRAVREQLGIPILMLSARSDEFDKVLGLRVGADDYLAKPFGTSELVARVQAILRRMEDLERRSAGVEAGDDPAIRVGDLEIDPGTRAVKVRGYAVDLRCKEFDLLYFLARHPRQVFSPAQLYERIWGTAFGDVGTVAVHIKRLRDKIERDPSHPALLKNIRGAGYKLEASK